MAIVFQDPMTSLNPVMTIGDQITEAMRVNLGISHSTAVQKTIQLLDRAPAEQQDALDRAVALGVGLLFLPVLGDDQRGVRALAHAARLVHRDEPELLLGAPEAGLRVAPAKLGRVARQFSRMTRLTVVDDLLVFDGERREMGEAPHQLLVATHRFVRREVIHGERASDCGATTNGARPARAQPVYGSQLAELLPARVDRYVDSDHGLAEVHRSATRTRERPRLEAIDGIGVRVGKARRRTLPQTPLAIEHQHRRASGAATACSSDSTVMPSSGLMRVPLRTSAEGRARARR